MDSATESSKGLLATLGSVLGLGGTLVCSLSMIVAAVGLFAAGGTAAAQGSMAGMGSDHQDKGMGGMGSGHRGGMAAAGSGDHAGTGAAHSPGWLDAVLRWGPEILVASVLLIVVSVMLRHRWAALPAIVGGLVLYVGMYAQPNLALMYTAIAVGTILLILAYVTSLRPLKREAQ